MFEKIGLLVIIFNQMLKILKSVKHKKLKDSLYAWILIMIAKNAIIFGDIIKEYAKTFSQQMNITDFTYH